MDRFIIFLALFAIMTINVNAYIDCCRQPDQCTSACSSQNCAYTLCCSSGCTVDGTNIPPCACACANCPNAALAASGLLGTKFAPAKLLSDEAFKIVKV